MLKVQGLRKRYGDRAALENVTFEVKEGERFGFLGPNGAGKTTAILIMAGALCPDEGTVTIDGDSPTLAECRRHIGLAPQSLAFYRDLTGEENVTLFGKLYGLQGRRLRDDVREALALVGLDRRGRERAGDYSGGMQRRLNMACALVHKPNVLYLDEPTAGVDPQSRKLLLDSITTLARQKRTTIVYTTHYMEEAQQLCDRVAILDEGRIREVDTVESLITKYGGPDQNGRATLEDVFLNLTGKEMRDE